MTVVDRDPYVAFRDELLDAGLLVATEAEGIYGRSGAFERVVAGVDAIAVRLAEAEAATPRSFPPVEPRAVFERTRYLESFPDLTGAVVTFDGDDRDHARLLAAVDAGDDWARHLTASGTVLCPAVCHQLYPTISGPVPREGALFHMHGWSFRHEPSPDPARMQAFRIHEVVTAGTPDQAKAFRDEWLDRALDALRSLDLDVDAVVANDPFFGRVGKMLAANQRDEQLKYEIVTEVANAERPTAIFSANYHQDHFGGSFGITTPDGDVAHSACVGFGLERITLALFRRHGLDVDRWPAGVQSRLWP
jgi:seryl-tRNA synthetase